MRTKVVAALLAALLALGATACGDDEPALEDPDDNGVEEMDDDQFDVEDELDDDDEDADDEG